MSRKEAVAMVLAFGIACGAFAEQPAASSVCVACHGASGEGNPSLGAPRIAGQNADYLARQLNNFKINKRAYHPDDKSGSLMRASVASLSAADIGVLATYYSKMEFNAAAAPTAKADVTAGKAIFDATCSSCHGLQAQGYPQLQAPNLRILDGAYITQQINSFNRGWRGDAEKSDQPAVWMRNIASHVSQPKDLAAVVQYIGSLPAK